MPSQPGEGARDDLREPPGGSFVGLMNLAAYIALAIGFLLAMLTSRHPALGPFLLFTAINLAWLALFLYMQYEENDPFPLWLELWGLAVLAAAALLCLPLGLGFDWLLPTLTVATVALASRWRQTFLVMLVMIAASAAAVRLADGRWDQVGSTLVQIAPAYVFAVTFSLVLRRQQLLRERAEDLAAEVSRSKVELEAAHAVLRARASQAEELAIARERNRMAREIHDTLGHYLTILAVQLETALKLEERDEHHNPVLRAELAEARRVTAECLAEVRRSVAALRPADLSAMSLRDALVRLVAESETLLPETEITLDVEDEARELPAELRLALYRCAQEALTNVRKHAAATKVLVRLRVGKDAARPGPVGVEAELTVLDNGQHGQAGHGAPSDENSPGAPEAVDQPVGFGLRGMRERIALLGGTVEAGPEPEQGWRVEVRVPPAAVARSASSSALATAGAESRDALVASSWGAEG
jgi:signal transduction histidine kinase